MSAEERQREAQEQRRQHRIDDATKARGVPLLEMPIAFGLTKAELVIHSGPHTRAADSIKWLIDTAGGDVNEQLKRVFTAAVMLAHENPSASFDECVGTAVIWERG